MFLTAPLLSKSSFFGSLINKCRQVFKPTNNKLNANKNNNFTPSYVSPISPDSMLSSSTPNAIININSCNKSRPLAVAHISSTTPTPSLKTIEERLGLPPRPKKPLTPYFRFMKNLRPQLVAENPKLNNIDIVRISSKRWETVDPKIKQSLQDDYKRDQEVYVDLRTKYDSKLSEDQLADIKQLKQELSDAKERKILRKRVKELGRPKRPASAFLRFIIKERTDTPQLEKQTYRDWHQKCTAKWARISDEEKAIYMAETRKELEKYRKDITTWEEKMIRSGNLDVVRHNNLIDRPEPKPKKVTK